MNFGSYPSKVFAAAARVPAQLPRRSKQIAQAIFDCIALGIAAAIAFKFRLGFDYQFNVGQMAVLAAAPLVAIPVFIRLGLYRAVLRYLPERILWTILQAMTVATLLWTAIAFFSASYGWSGVPRSVPVLYWLMGVFIITLSRFAAKALLYGTKGASRSRRTLIYGAGQAGTQLAAALHASGDAYLIGFIDDNRQLHGRDVAGLRVYSPDAIGSLITNFGIDDVIISVPSAPGARRLEIGSFLAQFPVTVRLLPSISDIVAGRHSVSTLREFDIGELIGRSTVPPDVGLIENILRGKTIIITGAGGSIGSQLAKLVAANKPRELYLVDNSEFALYAIQRKLAEAGYTYPIRAVLASVNDKAAMRPLFESHEIDLVLHAAAYKHIDLVEQNVREGIRNNVVGTKVVADLAFETGVKHFVLISTDKAVNPTSVMGATKRLSELIVRRYAEEAAERRTGQKFLMVRFGNVVGSSGSVVPLFKEQIERGGPVTVTDPEITRYFMAISEAVELIVQATALSRGGDTFLLDMGEPLSIYGLARNMIGLAGLRVKSEEQPDGDIEIKFVGMRPGEKLHEELLYEAGSAIPTVHPKIMRAKRKTAAHLDIERVVSRLVDALPGRSEAQIRELLFALLEELNSKHSDKDAALLGSNIASLPSKGTAVRR